MFLVAEVFELNLERLSADWEANETLQINSAVHKLALKADQDEITGILRSAIRK